MIRHILIVMAVYAAAVLESGEFLELGNGLTICWLLVAAAFAAWSFPAAEAVLWGALIGLLRDCAGAGVIGPGIVIVGTLTGLAAVAIRRGGCRSAAAFGLTTAILVGVAIVLTGLLQNLSAGTPLISGEQGRRVLSDAVATGFAAFIAMWACRVTPAAWLAQFLTPRKIGRSV